MATKRDWLGGAAIGGVLILIFSAQLGRAPHRSSEVRETVAPVPEQKPRIGVLDLATKPAGIPARQFILKDEQNLLTELDVERAIKAFRAACRPLGGDMWYDLEAVTARVFREYADYRSAKGWRITIELTGKVPVGPLHIPASIPGAGATEGHVLYAYLGGGRTPGAFVSKRATKALCGIRDYDSGADAFMPISELGFLGGAGTGR